MSEKNAAELADVNTSEATPHGCPVMHDALPRPTAGDPTRAWWPERLNLKILAKNQPASDPMDDGFNYREAFNGVDYEALKTDIAALLTDSRDWWPADFGNYGPFMVRMAWHSAGTYRVHDGRGGAGTGQQRFAPLNSWPDNVLLDRARRLLWPVKKKYGKAISWADLMILAGNVSLEQMGFDTFGFAGGRADVWEPEDDVYWGSETEWLGDEKRYTGGRDLEDPLAAVQMGLIYVNPEGPAANANPLESAIDIRETFARMAMNDEETVALIAGGHTFGKTHGAGDAALVGPEPEAAPMEQMGLGWKSTFGEGKGADAIGSGLEVTWTYHPTRWDNEFFHILFAYEWEKFESAAGAVQWRPVAGGGSDMVPEAHGTTRREPRMLTSDLALREDPIYREISLRFKDDIDAFADAFARAWFKLTHRDMGPKSRYLGPEAPSEDLLWQDPLPLWESEVIGDADVSALKATVLDSGLTVAELVSTAWASASTYRDSDKRGGANGARIALEPQRSWAANNPTQLSRVLETLQGIADSYAKPVSLADVIVIAGAAGIEKAAADAGVSVTVPLTLGRVDATAEQTDVESFGYLEPRYDGFRNYTTSDGSKAEYELVDKANLLGLSAPETAVLVGGLRVLGANHDGSNLGVFTDRPGALTNDFFVNVLDLDTQWKPTDATSTQFASTDGRWVGTRADLVFGSNSELRAVAEVYASDDAHEKFVRDFVTAWNKVMNADRFDLV